MLSVIAVVPGFLMYIVCDVLPPAGTVAQVSVFRGLVQAESE